MMTIMSVMMTIRPARVNPRSAGLPAVVRGSIEAISGCGAVDIDDAGRHAGVIAARIDGRRIARVGGRLDFFPIAALRDRILRQPPEILLADQGLQVFGIFLSVGEVVVDSFSDLE